jgi:ketosteroid isomerase-like protein
MKAEENRKIIEKYYGALAEGDAETFSSLHSEDVIFNVLGNTPVSGRFMGKTECFSKIASRVVRTLVPGTFKFAKKWRIMAADEKRVVGIMKGGGVAKTGLEYDQTYCQVFTIRDGKISELHEFLDTVLVEEALFGNRLECPREDPDLPFNF